MPKIIGYFWEFLRTSFWFIPAVLTVLAGGLAWLMLWLDKAVPQSEVDDTGWLYTGSVEGARQIMSTVAGSMITVAGVVFSITIVALTLASSQFGTRLLRNFIRDRGNQFVLGTFIATYVYCLLVLRNIRGVEEASFVPHIAVTTGIVLALASLGVLIYFIHHAAISMQGPVIIANVSKELQESIESLFPDKLDRNKPSLTNDLTASLPDDFEHDGVPILSTQTGYLQFINREQLMGVAKEHDLLIRVGYRPGHFVVARSAIAFVWPRANVNDDSVSVTKRAFAIGSQQTATQDVEFAMRQLVEIAVRALSPGINDPLTAMSCIDHLGAALCSLAERVIPSGKHADDDGNPRIVESPTTFGDLTDTAFRQIRQYGRTSAAVLIRMLESIATVLQRTCREGDREALLHHAELVMRCANDLPHSADCDDAEDRFRRIETIAIKFKSE